MDFQTKEEQIENICEQLIDLSIKFRGRMLTEEQWQKVREAWIEFGACFAPCRPPKKLTDSKTKEDDFDRAMEVLKK